MCLHSKDSVDAPQGKRKSNRKDKNRIKCGLYTFFIVFNFAILVRPFRGVLFSRFQQPNLEPGHEISQLRILDFILFFKSLNLLKMSR